MRYQSAPRNIYRHIILSEMKEAMAALPLVRGPDGAQAVVPLSAAWWHSPPCRACRRRARLQPQPPARNIRLTSKRPPWGGTRGHVWAGRAGVGAQLRCPPQDYGLSSWSDRLCAWGSAAGDAAFTPSFFSLLQEVTSQPVMGFDPLPPLDSIVSYTRPERYLLHPSFLRWHSRRVPGAPSAPGLGARGCSEPTSSSSIWEEEQPGLWRSPTAERTGRTGPAALPRWSLLEAAAGQRPLERFGC